MTNLADQFTDKQIDEFKEAFTLFDKNEEGEVPEGQIIHVLRALGIHETEEHILSLMKGEEDDTGSGTVDFPEFLAIIGKLMFEQSGEDHIREAFRVFDKDEDGFLTVEELKNIMMNMGERFSSQEVEEMIKTCGLTTGGLINYDTFAKLLGGGGVAAQNK